MKLKIYAIDPGPKESALVILDPETKTICGHNNGSNVDWFDFLRNSIYLAPEHGEEIVVVIEMVSNYGSTVGQETFETCVAIGHLEMAAGLPNCRRITRPDIKLELLGRRRGTDSEIRQALLELFGGKDSTKKGGPLHGIKSHEWSALAVAVGWLRKEGKW